MDAHEISISINGSKETHKVPDNLTLLRFIREHLGLTGSKSGCDTGECGACTVLLNGEPVNACLVLAVEVDGGEILTVEGLSLEGMDPLQEKFISMTGTQCGFCTPGILIAARALLDRNPNPSELEIKEALRGNLCRCTGYVRIIEAVQVVAKES
jgi:carbon-monoxide dehydrogenase small subunit